MLHSNKEGLIKGIFTTCGRLTGTASTWQLAIAGSPYYLQAEGRRLGKVYWNPERTVAKAVDENAQTGDVDCSTEIQSLTTCGLTDRELTSVSSALTS